MVQKEYKKRIYILLKINPLLSSLWWLPESNLIDKIIVSTDDKNIATFSKENGTEVPYLRKKSLSQYDSLIMNTVIETIEILDNFKFILLQPTSPLRTKNDIENVNNLQHQYLVESLVSVRKLKRIILFFSILTKKII